ncbi:MAG TPA: amino acid adenylation domain-containing protein [Thermoanaerobaculia bacterium]|nr:amino acid adenylation domain-containing protein [Thermoanaerobaculia bacterium]
MTPSATQSHPEGCIHQLIRAQAARTPDAEAVAFGGESLTYRELLERAGRVAALLQSRGVGPDTLVGLCAERSLDMMIGMLGILEAGGAYVPLDPSYPGDRLAWIWEDACGGNLPGRPSVLLTQRALSDLLPQENALYLEDLPEPAPAAAPGEPHPTHPDTTAYVIYTSGSTGRPKGVVVPHRGVVNMIRQSIGLLDMRPGDRSLQLASLGFDASVLEIFSALTAGACVVLTPRQTLMAGEALGAALRDGAITHLVLPPSLLDMVPAGMEKELTCLRSILVGGEACSAATAALWAPGRRMINAYAPTEATVYATASFCSGQGLPTLGGPIEEMSVHLQDADWVEVAGEGEGEICLGGVGVARGYLNRPDLTAERFIPDPFSTRSGARMYKSGDLARRLADGDLLFLGRVDFQVKIRGNRIELGEIEAVLGEHDGVQTAVVVARQEGATKRLVGYVVRRDPGLTVSALRAFLSARLPEYMVPEAFVFLAAMPMTPTGKVDRRALPEPGRSRPELDTPYAPPRDKTEEALARIWGELLGIDGIGVHDNLFELGGHSLLAAQIVTHVRQDLGVDLPLPEVFEHPTVELLARRIAVLREAAAEELPPIHPAPRDRHIPLSFAQERVWFLTQLSPGNWAYNFQFSVRFRGPLRPAVLEASLSEVIRRHEVLRTTFPAVDGRPAQLVHPPWRAEIPIVDLRLAPEREALANQLVQQEIRKPFDLERLPLLRWLLIRLGDEDHLLLQVEHHFVHDGWSLAVFLREVKELYIAYHEGRPSPLPEPPVQYADFAVWQREWLQGEALAGHLAWWVEHLAGSPPVLELPADRPRLKAHSFRGAGLRADLPRDLYADVRSASRREGVTLFMTSLAAFCALLYRYTGQEDVLLGSGIANRRLRELEDMVGMVVNTIVLRAGVAGGMTFRELAAGARRATLAAHAHQDVPFERIVERLQPDRELSRNPLFQVLFSFHDSPVPDLDFCGMTGDLLERHNGSAKSDLNVVAKPRAEQRVAFGGRDADDMTFIWEYSGDLFDGSTIDRMWAHYQSLLRAFVKDPGRRISELPLLSEAERGQLAEWSGPVREEDGAPVHRQVAAWAERTPDAIALADRGVELTYAGLMEEARDLAYRLRALGVEPETVVAVCTERSPEAVVAALGILEAGGAWLPLDPSYPSERLRYLLEDSGARAVVARPEFLGMLPETGLPIVDLDLGRFLPPGRGPLEAGGGQEGGSSLAYVIYTSGSTGRPKGVEIPHQGLSNLVSWHCRTYGVTPADRATMLAGPAFDASVWEVWPYLASGASVHVPDADTRAEPGRLLSWMAAQGITLAFLPTPLAEALIETEMPSGLALRALLTGGDRLRRAPESPLPFALVNHYGPTESTVVTTAGEVLAGRGVPSIGRPIDGLSVWLLDRDLRKVPPGVPGELCVGGNGLARGYRGRPDLTAERFLPDPVGRLYRTGDLARWRKGELEFLGRIDHQVKVRGYRIELGEIEAVLAEHPEVREAVVTVRERGGERVLVGYVVGEGALHAFLSDRLPSYMVPATFVFLPALPLTPNGKLDLRALPEPEWGGEREEDAGPSSPLEETLAGIWSSVLGVGSVGVHDNFFKLGGHSLMATRVLSRVRDAAGVDVPLSALFEEPTVAGLARVVGELMRGAESSDGPIPRRVADGPAPVSFAQERLWFLDQLAPGLTAYSIVRVFRLRGPLDTEALARAAAGVIRRHAALRTTFAALEDRPVQVIAAITAIAAIEVPVIDVASPEEADRRLKEEAQRPFDLRSGPLLRMTVARLAPDDHRLLLAMHHIVSDGWSMGILFRELSALYRGDGHLPELPIQYADYAVWQRERLQGDRLAALVTYWREALAGAPAVSELPLDRPRPQVQSYRGDQVERELAPDVAAGLRDLARRSGSTLFMGLLASLGALLSRYAGRPDVVVGSPVAGRTRSEVEPLIGFFVNTLALRLRWEGDPGFAGLLARARRTVLMAHAHQELPFEKLVAELSPERSLGHTPLFQVMLTLQERDAGSLEILDAETLPLARGESRFDLELGVIEGDGGLRLLWRYDRDLFDEPTVARMAGHHEQLLRGLLQDPEARLSGLALLSPAEEEQLRSWNGPPLLPLTDTLHSLFAAQAARTPDAPAVISAAGELTYGELADRAGRIARWLRASGVGPEIPVGVLLERGPDLIAALLGVLQAGGFYVPLDPAYPEARTAFLLEDSGARIVITEESLRDVPDSPDADRSDDGGAGPDNLAYLIYTSGSTGRPKGVAIEHRSAVALLRWASGVFPAEDLAGVFVSTSVCFDLSVFEIFLPLSRGGALVLGENALALAGLPQAERVTLINTVPSAMEELLRLGAVPRSVRAVNLAGEPLTAALVDRIYSQTGAERVFDLYGPSEDTTYSTFALRQAGGPATIGRPIAGTRCVLLDPWGSRVPVRVPGEIHLGGAGLARGYLNRPDLTAERFVPDPLREGERLYRTGDLARWRPDGNLELLGRIDHQVKVRGFRIELGEIEAAILAHPGVREVAVAVLEERLVAYVVPPGIETEELRELLSRRLPAYMVPTAWVVLTALPRTPNGKLDRKALPRPEMSGDGFVAPETPEEERLAAIWAEVLGIERVGIHDDFFRLGGHSLLVVRLMSQVRREMEVDLPLRSLFQTPTVAGLARAVVQAGLSGSGGKTPRIAAVSRAGHRRTRPSEGGQV